MQKLQDQLDQLPTIRDVLYALYLVPGGAPAQTKVTSSSEAQAPLSVHVLDLVDEIDDAIDQAAQLTIDALIRQPEMQFKLWRGGGWKMDYLDGVDRALGVGTAWRKADGVIGMTRPWQQRIAKCPECDLRTLGNIAQSETVTCSSCGATMTADEYAALCTTTANKKKEDQ